MASTSMRGKKVRPPRKILANNHAGVSFEQEWKVLSSAFKEINTKNASQLSFEQLYRSAYGLTLKKHGPELYENVRLFIEQWLSLSVRDKLRTQMAGTILAGGSAALLAASDTEKRAIGEKFMKELHYAFSDHDTCTKMKTDVLMYMDRVYCAVDKKPTTYVLGMALFRDFILKAPLWDNTEDTVMRILFTVVLQHIELERQGEVIDNLLIRSCIYMLEGIYETDLEDENEKLYLTRFEPEFLHASKEYYASEGVQMLRTTDAGTYLRIANDQLAREADRCRKTICELTAPKITKVVEDELLAKHFKEVLAMESGGRWMLDNDRYEDMLLVYDLNARIDSKKSVLVSVLQARIADLGKEVNESITKTEGLPTTVAIKWVEEILLLIEKFDRFWKNSFRTDPLLQAALNKSYEGSINDFAKGPEFISLFLDENLKRGLKGKTEAEVDGVLEKAITLIRFVRDKDLFERYYKKHLARRLLLNRSVSEDVERQMISRMKVEVGNTFTQKLEGMFKDMTVSADLTLQFQRSMGLLDPAERPGFALSVNILTSTFWPEELTNKEVLPCLFPEHVDRAKDKFVRFYNSKHNGRKLMWQANLGSADITAWFPANGSLKDRRYDINVSSYGMIILELFNTDKTLTLEQILDKTQITKEELSRNLQSLAVAPKTRVLIKEPMSKEINPGDRFSFNEAFHSKFVKIKIGVVAGSSKVEGDKERQATEARNDEHRAGSIEAAIVRIMKQRKALSHQQLVTEVIEQMSARFKPDIGMIKKRIESLIEREYLERDDKSDRPAYRYLA